MARKNLKQQPIEERDNSIGIEAQRNKQHKQAFKALDQGKIVEAERRKVGFLWIRKGKIAKQIHPSKLKLHLSENWILAKVN